MKLCTNCHERIHWTAYVTSNDWYFCKRGCELQWNKLSNEAQKAAHYEWVREEALANSQSELFS